MVFYAWYEQNACSAGKYRKVKVDGRNNRQTQNHRPGQTLTLFLKHYVNLYCNNYFRKFLHSKLINYKSVKIVVSQFQDFSLKK